MLLTPKTVKIEKYKMYKNQNGICPICELPLNAEINKNHLDHDHELNGLNAGKVRGLLCIYCNPFEGMVKHKFQRAGLKNRVDYLTFLKNMIKYLERDITGNNIHPKYISDKMKQFKRLTKSDMQLIMQKSGYEYNENDDKNKLITKYKKQFKRGLQCK